MAYYHFSIPIFLCFLSNYALSRELKFVQAIWRHGDRAPDEIPYPNDPNKEDAWERGWNQITNTGVLQMIELGKFFRERYAGNFTSSKFKSNEVFIRSSPADRCIASAQAMLYGFFPPTENQIWDSKVHWQPIPIWMDVVNDEDPLLKPKNFKCPAYEKLFVKMNKQWICETPRKYAKLLHFLSDATGFGPNMKFDDIYTMAQVYREINHNLTQPSWMYQTWPEYENKTTLKLVTELELDGRIREYKNQQLSHLKIGLLLGDLLKRAQAVVGGVQKKPSKMVLYSSHYSTLIPLAYALGIFNGQPNMPEIPYASALIMEIWKNDLGRYEVQLFFKNHVLKPVSILGCTHICPFETFYEQLRNMAIFDEMTLYKECGYNDKKKDKKSKNKNKKKNKDKNSISWKDKPILL